MSSAIQHLSVAMRDAVDEVLTGIKLSKTSNYYNIELQFHTTNNPELSPLLSKELKSVTIEQDYINNFTDKIIAELQLDQITYKVLYYNRNDLFCTLKFTPIPRNSPKPECKEPTYTLKYRAVLIDNPDIFKSIPAYGVEPEQRKRPIADYNNVTLRIRVELIDDIVYTSRRNRIHGIFTNVKMEDMLRYAVKQFGFKKAVIVKPDNDEEYVNFVIPPDYGIADIMGFFQNSPGFGVYNNGFCSYVTDGTWYVYPRHGDAICKRVVHIYATGQDTVAGLEKYNWLRPTADGDTINSILLNNRPTERNWSPLGTENSPNAANIQTVDAILDYSRELVKDGEFNRRPVIMNVASVPSDVMSEDNSINLVYRKSNSNLFTICSELGALQQTVINFTLESAEPFMFRPATQVQYHYDHVNGYKTISGKCEYAKYVFAQAGNIALYPLFSGTVDATIVCDNFQAREDGNI